MESGATWEGIRRDTREAANGFSQIQTQGKVSTTYRIFTAIKPLWQTLRCSASAFHSVLHSTLARHHSCDSQPVQLAASPPSTCRSYCEVRRGLLRVQVASRNAEFSGSFAENSARNRAAARHTEPYGRRRPGGAHHMTVACDGGAGAQAGVRHRDGRRAAPTERRVTRTVASVLRATARAARCFSFSTCRS